LDLENSALGNPLTYNHFARFPLFLAAYGYYYLFLYLSDLY
jgi:hypothetical protein